ncbi:MAG: hypothetical protein HZC01_04085 [Candidatus Kerfeldbacteria bacterium]|nr:hypothetical protein [Candidatus Kerfeldbacteria bacterium]
MCDQAFPHFYRVGGCARALHLRRLQYVRRQFDETVADPRQLASQDYAWVERHSRFAENLREKWVAAVSSQFFQTGIHLRNLWNDQFYFRIPRRVPFPKVQILGAKAFLNECPLCCTTSVELLRLTSGDATLSHSRVRWLFMGSVDPSRCTHHVPVDDVSWKIINNALYLFCSDTVKEVHEEVICSQVCG